MATFGPIVEGWTATLGPFTLKDDGAAFNLTNFTVAIEIKNGAGTDMSAAGTVTKLTQSGATLGQVTYAPHANDFVRSTGMLFTRGERFTIRFKVTDGSNKVQYFPNGQPDEIDVFAE